MAEEKANMPPVSIRWVLRLNTAYQNFFPPPTPLLFLPTHHLQNCFEPTICWFWQRTLPGKNCSLPILLILLKPFYPQVSKTWNSTHRLELYSMTPFGLNPIHHVKKLTLIKKKGCKVIRPKLIYVSMDSVASKKSYYNVDNVQSNAILGCRASTNHWRKTW